MSSRPQRSRRDGFTLLELLTVVAILALLAALLLPALASARSKSRSLACLSNIRQLGLACLLYADDAGDRLPYNLGWDEIKRAAAQNRFPDWSNTVMSWELDSDNTNSVLLTSHGLGPYASRSPQVYRCPSDRTVSDLQAAAGWTARVRSFSLNAMVGDAGEFSQAGYNVNNPDYRQFFKITQIPKPARIFTFIEEHPDSINDGYFLNYVETLKWHDLPASYHQGAANLVFADGHAEHHAWRSPTTRPPSRPDGAGLPFAVPPTQRADFDWLMERTSEDVSYYTTSARY